VTLHIASVSLSVIAHCVSDISLRRLFFSKRQANSKKVQRSKKVEPKTLFANERTYLQWMQAGVLLTTLSLGLLSLEGDSSKAGYFMAPIAVLVMAWSTLR
jgi:hypothetical protein